MSQLRGETFTVYVRVEAGRIAVTGPQHERCAISMASASIMTEIMRCRSLDETRSLLRRFAGLRRDLASAIETPADSGALAALELIPDFRSRVNCTLLGRKTLEAARDGRSAFASARRG